MNCTHKPAFDYCEWDFQQLKSFMEYVGFCSEPNGPRQKDHMMLVHVTFLPILG